MQYNEIKDTYNPLIFIRLQAQHEKKKIVWIKLNNKKITKEIVAIRNALNLLI